MIEDKRLSVSAIENGTVIDHIPAQNLFNVISILELDKFTKNSITFGTNFKSKRLGTKAIIKVSNKYFEDIDINKIALVAPHAKLNIIKNYKVVDKREVNVPNMIKGITKCVNPKCITNNENITTKFDVIDKNANISLKCHYCEKITDQEHIIIIR
jgi:aspartate carbamoyltransferase regulatory subunit